MFGSSICSLKKIKSFVIGSYTLLAIIISLSSFFHVWNRNSVLFFLFDMNIKECLCDATPVSFIVMNLFLQSLEIPFFV